nr:putative sulfate transporter 3.3 [Quercus suber]
MTLFSLQGISYAKLANLPPIVGLYSSFVPPLVYAVLGSSRDLAVGPVSIASLILGSLLSLDIVLTTSAGIMDHEEARRKNAHIPIKGQAEVAEEQAAVQGAATEEEEEDMITRRKLTADQFFSSARPLA